MKNIIGRKVGMTSVFTADGRYVPVTVIEAGPCTVLQRKTVATDGYEAAVLAFGDVKKTRLNKPDAGASRRPACRSSMFRAVRFSPTISWSRCSTSCASLQESHP